MDSVIVFPDKAEFTDDWETEKKGIGIGQVSWICAAEEVHVHGLAGEAQPK